MVGNIFAFITVMDLTVKGAAVTQTQDCHNTRTFTLFIGFHENITFSMLHHYEKFGIKALNTGQEVIYYPARGSMHLAIFIVHKLHPVSLVMLLTNASIV